jgi:hypothetical protein
MVTIEKETAKGAEKPDILASTTGLVVDKLPFCAFAQIRTVEPKMIMIGSHLSPTKIVLIYRILRVKCSNSF